MEEELKTIREVVLEVAKKRGIKVEKIILFGSRARGDFKEDSDWDVLIVTKEKLDRRVEDEFWLEVGRMLVRRGIITEVIVTSKRELEEYSKYYGFVHYHALKEGVVVL